MGKPAYRQAGQFPVESRVAGEDLFAVVHVYSIFREVYSPVYEHHKPLREAITGTGEYLEAQTREHSII